MVLRVNLKLDNKEVDVSDYDYDLRRDVDSKVWA